jgi:hypothetical protein
LDQVVSEFVMLHALSRGNSARPKDRKRLNWKVRIKRCPTPQDIDGIKQSIQEMTQQYNCPKFLVNLLVDAKQQ